VNFRRAQPSVVLPPNGSGKCLTTHYIIKLRDDEDKAFGGKMLTSPEVTGLHTSKRLSSDSAWKNPPDTRCPWKPAQSCTPAQAAHKNGVAVLSRQKP
jgi:hypothetical protein